jgi:hypothetical protein
LAIKNETGWISVATGAVNARDKLRAAHEEIRSIFAEEPTNGATYTWVSMARLRALYTLIQDAGIELTQGLKGNRSGTTSTAVAKKSSKKPPDSDTLKGGYR